MKTAGLLLLLAGNAFAGGDFASGKVTAFQIQNGVFSFHFIQTGTRPPLLGECKEVDVQIRKARWYSWIPFARFNHPTNRESLDAGKFVGETFQKSVDLNLGYMGFGFELGEKECSYISRGARVENWDGRRVVVLDWVRP